MEKIRIEAVISADIAKVWNYWTKPEHITKWNFASDDWHCPSANNDLKAGGKFTFRMKAKDGSFGFDFEGIYDEIIDHKKIAYTMLDGRKAITDFESKRNEIFVSTILTQKMKIRWKCRKWAGRQYCITSKNMLKIIENGFMVSGVEP